MFLAEIVPFLAAFVGGACGYVVASWTLRSKLYSLEYEVATLQEQVIRETKKRAAAESKKSRSLEEMLSTHEQREPVAPASPEPWFAKFVHPNLKKQ